MFLFCLPHSLTGETCIWLFSLCIYIAAYCRCYVTMTIFVVVFVTIPSFYSPNQFRGQVKIRKEIHQKRIKVRATCASIKFSMTQDELYYVNILTWCRPVAARCRLCCCCRLGSQKVVLLLDVESIIYVHIRVVTGQLQNKHFHILFYSIRKQLGQVLTILRPREERWKKNNSRSSSA